MTTPESLAGDIAAETQAQRLTASHAHAAMLSNAMSFSDLSHQGEEPGVAARQVAKCMSAISARVPMTPGPLHYFTKKSGWYRHEAIRSLFKAYLDAGYISLAPENDRESLALEFAIVERNVDSVRALLDCGADERLIPSKGLEWLMGGGEVAEAAPPGAEPAYSDVHDFIEKTHGGSPQAAQMSAFIRGHAMERRIREESQASRVDNGPDGVAEAQDVSRARRRTL